MIPTQIRALATLLLSLCLAACASRPFSDTQAVDRSGLLYGQFIAPAGLPRDRQLMVVQLDAEDRAAARQPVTLATDGSFHVIAAAPGRYRIALSAGSELHSDDSINSNPLQLEPGELYFIGLLGVGSGTIDWLPGEACDLALLATVRPRIADAAWRNRVDYELDQRER